MELTRLKANSQYRPCVDEKPYFSWVLTSEKKNVMQTSYHITVTGPEEVVWDSGIVESDKSIFVEYAGPPLKSLCEYRWTVTVTDNTGDSAVASSSFETGFMQKEWSAQWDLKDGKFHIEVDIPCNTTAVVNLPDGSSYKIGSGPYTFDCDVKQ